MSGDNFTEEGPKKRAVLGDVTNLPVKREFSSISDGFGLKSRYGYGKKMIFDLGVEKLVNEKCKSKVGVCNDTKEKGFLLLEDKQSCQLSDTDSDVDADADASPEINVTKGPSNLLEGSVDLLQNVGGEVGGEVGDASRDSCASSGSVPTNYWSSKKDSDDDDGDGGDSFEVKQSNCNSTGHVSTTSVDKDLGAGKLACSNLTKSQGSTSFEMDRCIALKGDDSANLDSGANLLKACSCSFCLKAAFIWSDLHYQDIKGRISVLKKSQKEASILVNKYARGKEADIHSQGNSIKSSKLESDLTAQWSSLFHHMEDIYVHESNQLQDGAVALRDLRDNCKTDLESINEIPYGKY